MPSLSELLGQYKAVLLEDAQNPFLNDVDGMERFQRTKPSAKGTEGPHIYAENPRNPAGGKVYLRISLPYLEFPRMVYRARVVKSQEVARDLDAIVKANDKKRQELWEAFLDRLTQIELEVDFRQLALPSTVPDPTALRLLRRSLVLQIQAAESESWKARNQKTYEEYKLWCKSPENKIVNGAEELLALGRGWYLLPTCTTESEANIPAKN